MNNPITPGMRVQFSLWAGPLRWCSITARVLHAGKSTAHIEFQHGQRVRRRYVKLSRILPQQKIRY